METPACTTPSDTTSDTTFIPSFYPSGKLPMTGRNRVIETLLNETPDRLPRSFAADFSIHQNQWEVLDCLYQRYPSDILIIDSRNPEAGYCNQVQDPIDLSADKFDQTVDLLCDITSQFSLGIMQMSPWSMLQSLLAPDSTEDYDDLLVRFEQMLQPWLNSSLDGLCLYDPISSLESGWDHEAMLNFTDLTPFYKLFVKKAHQADKYAFFDFGGKVLEVMPTLLKLKADAVACVLDTQTAIALSDFTASFKPHSEEAEGRRLTFWACLPNQSTLSGDWYADKKAAQSILTELNQYNKGVIARGFWTPEDKWQVPALALQAWEQGIPVPKPVVPEQSEQVGQGAQGTANQANPTNQATQGTANQTTQGTANQTTQGTANQANQTAQGTSDSKNQGISNPDSASKSESGSVPGTPSVSLSNQTNGEQAQ